MDRQIIKTPVGDLVPFYEIEEGRQKNRPSVEYYSSGELYSIYLQEQTIINTPVGEIGAELITFYKSGAVKRIFPLYGQCSGFWSEDDEYSLAEEVTVPLFGKEVSVKPMCLYFYESGTLRSLTIWPKEKLGVATRYGIINTDLGVELYESGRLKSIEPVLGTVIRADISERERLTPGITSSVGDTDWNDGVFYPYDATRLRMHADHNSLEFDEKGAIKKMKTVPLYRKKKSA